MTTETADYGWSEEHPIFTRADWKYEVLNSDTRLSYNDWVAHRVESILES